jgi:hypothetical protein
MCSEGQFLSGIQTLSITANKNAVVSPNSSHPFSASKATRKMLGKRTKVTCALVGFDRFEVRHAAEDALFVGYQFFGGVHSHGTNLLSTLSAASHATRKS